MLKSLIISFKNAIRGIVICIKNERNFRIHIVAIIFVLCFSIIYELTLAKLAIIFAVFSLVLFAELINSAIEEILNIHVDCYNIYARNAKDIAAGAVLVTAIFSVVIAVLLFRDEQGWQRVINLFIFNSFTIIIFVCLTALSVIFIIGKKK